MTADRSLCPTIMDERCITELTVNELEELIRRTVRKSVAEVMIEYAIEADVEAQVAYDAEMNDLLRHEMQSYGPVVNAGAISLPKVDD